MSELISNLNQIESCKLDIKSAIEAKGVDMTGVSFPDYATAIGSITTQFVTSTLSVSVNNTYYPEQGVDGFSMVVVDVPQSVTGYTEKDLTEHTYVVQNLNNSASFVASNAFITNNNLLTVNLPNCSIVYESAFNCCSYLTTVNLPVCTEIYQYAFNSNRSLNSVSIPMCTTIHIYTFSSCGQLTSIYCPNVTYVASSAFINDRRLALVDLPKCTRIDTSAFMNCAALTSVSIPVCEYLNTSAFGYCSQLVFFDGPKITKIENYGLYHLESMTSINLPRLSYLGGLAMESNRLTEVDLPCLFYLSGAAFNVCPYITTIKVPALVSASQWYGNGALLGCTSLSQLYIGLEVPEIIPYSRLFNNQQASTSLLQGIGSIYVNAENYDSYTTAVGWSSLSSLMVSVEYSTPLLSLSDGVLYGIDRYLSASHILNAGITAGNITEVNVDCYYINQNTFISQNITKINLDACYRIGMSAFADCGSLSEITLGVCEYLEDYAFRYCNLNKITIKTDTVCSIHSRAFYGGIDFNNYSIFVPTSLVDSYKSAQYWSGYSSHIFPISE